MKREAESNLDQSAEKAAAAATERLFSTDHLLPTIGGRTARGGVITMASHFFKFGIGIIATIILARLLSPQDYGLIGMVAVATNFVAMFKDLGLSHATVQRPEISRQQISTLFWVNLALSLGTMALMGILAPAIAWFYGDSRLVAITLVSATGFILGGLAVQHEALLKRQMRFASLSFIAIASMTVGYAVGIIFALNGFSYWSLVFSQLALLGTNAVLIWITCRWFPGLPQRGCGVRAMLSFGGNITAYSTVNYFSKNADTLLIGKVWGAAPLGLYNKASQLVGLPTDQVNEPLAAVAIPALSRLADDAQRYRKSYRRMMEKVLLFVMPAISLIVVGSDWLVAIVLGPQWLDAAPILFFMGIAGLLQPVMGTTGWLLVSQGRGRDMFRWSLISAPISIASIFIGLNWGAIGVAASYSLSRVFVTNPLMYWFVGRSGPVRTRDFYRLIFPFALAQVTAILACTGLRIFINPASVLVGLTLCTVIILAANIGILLLVPSGRLALSDLRNAFQLLKPEPSVEANAEKELTSSPTTRATTFLPNSLKGSIAK